MTDENKLLAAALSYAAAGWPVFPCKPGSKEPATVHGFHDASTDPDVIWAWWQRSPYANVAIATGAPAVDVLDVDVKPEGTGFPAFNRLQRAGLLTGSRALVKTPSGGVHAYFTGTEQGCGALRRHFLDFKARGGYVLAPPSEFGGRTYELADHRSDSKLLDWATVRRLLDPPQPAGPVRTGGKTSIISLAKWLAEQPEGSRNNALFWSACRAVEAGCGDADLEELVTAAISTGLDEHSTRRTIASAQRRIGGRV